MRSLFPARGKSANWDPRSRVYIYQEFPKFKHHWNGKTIIIKSADEEASLTGGWANFQTEFDLYKDARRIRNKRYEPGKWLDEWSVPGLSAEHRKRIKAQLLRADSAFERSLDHNPDSGALASMRQAFDGIARVLYEAGILSENLLHTEIPQLVWESAIAGGWWRTASETYQGIFPERLGHYWVWRDDSRDWNSLFRAEGKEWEAKLLEDSAREIRAASGPTDPPGPQIIIPAAELASKATPASVPSEEAGSGPSDGNFASKAQRIEAIAAYTTVWRCSQAALARSARVNAADLSKWKRGLLPAGSDKKARVEKVLTNNDAPTAKPLRNS